MKLNGVVGLFSLCLLGNVAFAQSITQQAVLMPTSGQDYHQVGNKVYVHFHYATGHSVGNELCKQNNTDWQGPTVVYKLDYQTFDLPILDDKVKLEYDYSLLNTSFSSHAFMDKGIVPQVSNRAMTSINAYASVDLDSEALFSGEPIALFKYNKIPIKKIRYTCQPVYAATGILPEPIKGELTISLGNIHIDSPMQKTCLLRSARTIALKQSKDMALIEQGEEIFAGEFALKFDCADNSNGQHIAIAFTDQNDLANGEEILTLNQNSTAQGMGLKMYPFHLSEAVKLSPEQHNILDPEQASWLQPYAFPDEQVNENYDLFYVKTDDVDMSLGEIRASATVTVFYQ